MKKVCVVTAIRSEYGLLKNLINKLNNEDDIELKLVVTGAHLLSDFGNTVAEIEEDGLKIDKKIEIILETKNSVDISKAMADTLIEFTKYFEKEKFDLLVLLGDRYEALAIATAAMNTKTPIAHLYGGSTTVGAMDDVIRHAITKMSYIHFTGTERYRKRVIQLGEDPDRVFVVGTLGVENIKQMPLKTQKELEDELKISLEEKYAVLVYHPVTLSKISINKQIKELTKGLEDSIHNYDLKYIIIGANADKGGLEINEQLKAFSKQNKEKVYFFKSLTVKNYLSLIKNSEFLIGNSSSGIVEVPSFKVPTINIGERQKGRISAKSIINIDIENKKIAKAIEKCLFDKEFKEYVKTVENPLEKENTSDNIINIIRNFLFKESIDLQKIFYDLDD